jgi:aryl-alcohol dehydrogenase-like predicted oxidoreductase
LKINQLSKRKLGLTGLEVSTLGLGTVKLGRNQQVKYPHDFKIPNDRQAGNLLSLARDYGINLIDTAPAYGSSEQRLGKLLRGQRQDWLICTKVGENFTDGISTYDFKPDAVRRSIERSLQRLNTDVIDIALIHSNGNDLEIINRYGTLDVLAELKQEGKLLTYGMSTKTVDGGLLAARKSDVVMVTWNLQYQDDLPVIEYCQRHHIGVLIKKALASGHMADDSSIDGGTILSDYENQDNLAKKSFGLAGKSLTMILNHPAVSSVIIGTINPDHLLANIKSVQAAGC